MFDLHGKFVSFSVPTALVDDQELVLPLSAGGAGSSLVNNGTGNLLWSPAAVSVRATTPTSASGIPNIGTTVLSGYSSVTNVGAAFVPATGISRPQRPPSTGSRRA